MQHKSSNMSSSSYKKASLETYFNTIETKPEVLAKEKQFEESLRNFYRQKWSCPLKPPVINGTPINLYKLYSIVSSNGGWSKVSNQDKWHQIAQDMGYSENISMINNGIKLIYMRFLSKYEEVQTLGEIDDHDNDIYGAKSRTKMYFNFASSDCPIPSLYKDKKIDASENEYSKIVKSLYSGLPNEVDFAFNVLTVMSNPGPFALKIEKCPFLLNLMIAHAGVYGDDKEIQTLAENGWKDFCDHKFDDFWANAGISDEQIFDYIPISKKDSGMLETLPLKMEFDPTNSTCFRVSQVTSILRNLSFESFNVHAMGKSDILIKFMCVCVASKHVRLVNDALDILSNIGNEIDLITSEGIYCNVMLLKVICDCLHSDDKNKVLHSLEIIAALCQNEKNEAVCAEFLDFVMVNRIFQLATVKDILICIHTLETLYQFSELGRASCNRIISVPNSIELLVSLLTNDAQSFGRTGLSGIQVVESFGHQQSVRQHYPLPSTGSVTPYRPQQYSSSSQPPQAQTSSAYHHHHQQQQQQQTPRTVHTVQRIHHPPTQQQTQQPSSHTPNLKVTHDEKLKALTTKWIKDNVIAEPDSLAVRGEMYAACVEHLRSANGIMSGTVNLFTQILQSVFPNATIHQEQKDNKLCYYIKGVRHLNQTSSNNTVASNYPVMQKILATPKQLSQTVRIVPAIPSQTNGVKEVASEEKPATAPEVQKEQHLNHDSEIKDSEDTDGESDQILEACDEIMETDANGGDATHEIEDDGMEQGEEEDLINDITDDSKIEICDEENAEDFSQNNDEQNENPIVEEVENSAGIEESIEAMPKKRINGHIVENGDDKPIEKEEEKEKTTNGICNGIKSDENIQQNGHVEEALTTDTTELNGITSNHDEDEEDKLPEGDPAKIDETVEAVSKVPPKNGKINSTEKAVEEVLLTNGTKGGKKRKAATPKTTKKKARVTKESVSEEPPKDKDVEAASTEINNIPSTSSDFMCEWNACGALFSTSEAISLHIIKEHLTEDAKNEDNTFLCLWPGCNKTRRAKWSLITHCSDHHCQEHQLRQACTKRAEMGGDALYLAAIQQQFAERINEPETIPTYTQAAAMDAIRRHSAVHYQREITDEQEGPVTKCIRLTTALILRNIARYSEEGRCKLRRFELQLCPLALSRLEASGALIQCLAEMDNTKSQEPIPYCYQPPLPQPSTQFQQQEPQQPVFVAPYPPSQKE